MKIRSLFAAAIAIPSIALVQSSYRLTINGKAVEGSAIVVKGETYVPLKALQAAGVKSSLTTSVLSLSFAPAGGSFQVGALEGALDEWLFNGVWRFRVSSIAPLSEDRTGWKINVELRNGTKADNIALSGTGLRAVQLVLSDGKTLTPYNITEISDAPFAQSEGKTIGLTFYEDEIGGRKPEKLLIIIKPDVDLTKYMKDSMKISYTAADPSFRIRLPG